MSLKKEVSELCTSLEDAGYKVELRRGSNHYKVTDPADPRKQATLPSSPSDRRFWLAATTQLRQRGFAFTFRGKDYIPAANPAPVGETVRESLTVDHDRTSHRTSPHHRRPFVPTPAPTPDQSETEDAVFEWVSDHEDGFSTSEAVRALTRFDGVQVERALAGLVDQRILERDSSGTYRAAQTVLDTATVTVPAVEVVSVAAGGVRGKLLAWIADRDAFTFADIREGNPDVGVSTIRNLLTDLVKGGTLSRPKLGSYINNTAVQMSAPTKPVDVVEVPEPVQEDPMPETSTVDAVTADIEHDILAALDALIDGNIPIRHIPAVMAWVNDTKNLIDTVKN